MATARTGRLANKVDVKDQGPPRIDFVLPFENLSWEVISIKAFHTFSTLYFIIPHSVGHYGKSSSLCMIDFRAA